MRSIKEAATQFLANRRVAVTGVSRAPQGHGSNVVYQRLRERGYEVFAVNPLLEAALSDVGLARLNALRSAKFHARWDVNVGSLKRCRSGAKERPASGPGAGDEVQGSVC